VTIEDEEAPGLAKRVPQALEVILANAENEAVSVVLIHSNESHFKAAAEQELLRELPADIGKTDMLSFARFWRVRDRLQWSVTTTAIPSEAVLQVKSADSVARLTFEFRRAISTITGGATLSSDIHRVVLPELKPGETMSFRLTVPPSVAN
jgi:hypothetical protein